MSVTGNLPARQSRFVAEYMIDLNATQAAIRAGYSARTAQEQSSRLLSKVIVQEAIAVKRAEQEHRLEVNADWVIAELVKNVERGRFEKDLSDSNKALEMLGKHLQMFPAPSPVVVDNRTQVLDMQAAYGDDARERLRVKLNTLAERFAEGNAKDGDDYPTPATT